MKIDWSGRSHSYSSKDINYLIDIIKTADPLTQGKYLREFEKIFAKYIGKKNVFAVSSAAAALEIISLLLNLKKNDEVIIPAHTYCASAISFARQGAKIVWSDINFATRVVDLEDIKRKITTKTKAILIVHLYGYACDFRGIIKFCRKKNIKIIEDCAQSLGAEIQNRKVGILGDFSCYSFHSVKNITTLGEGGMLYVKEKNFALKVPGLRHNGHCHFKFKRKNYWLPAMGNIDLDVKNKWPYKFTLSEIQCGAGILMMKKLDKLNQLRINRAKKFIKSLSNFNELNFNSTFNNQRHVYHLLTAYYEPSKKINRNNLIQKLYKNYSIKCAVQFYPLYKYPLFKKMGFANHKCPKTEKFYNNMISFPFHVWMSNKQFNHMIFSVKKSLIDLHKYR
jgi:dTDP-4-amino-4,6-dideoxygalactose transaminase